MSKDKSIPILEVGACAVHMRKGPRAVMYCGDHYASFVGVPVPREKTKLGKCGFTHGPNFAKSFTEKINGDLDIGWGQFWFSGDLEITGSVNCDKLSVGGTLKVGGDLKVMNVDAKRIEVGGNLDAGIVDGYWSITAESIENEVTLYTRSLKIGEEQIFVSRGVKLYRLPLTEVR
jgi:hypothetical protein